MRKPRLGKGAAGVGDFLDCANPDITPFTRPDQLLNKIDLPVDGIHPRPMRPCERFLLVCMWWRLRREGLNLPAAQGVILIDGGNP